MASSTLAEPTPVFKLSSEQFHADRQRIRDLHERTNWSHVQSTLLISVFFTIAAGSVYAWNHGYYGVLLLCWGVQAHFGHANLIAFHEASHYLLHRSRLLNELTGLIIGSLILTPLSVYRFIHQQHHSYLGTERDTELWPFVNPGTPRAYRILAAVGELCVGFFYTPIVFLHGVLVADRMPKAIRRRIALEYLLCAVVWTTILSVCAYFDLWIYFLVGYFVPALVAGNLQTIRKFTEHMGLLGDDIPSKTRTVVAKDWIGKTLSFSMMNIDVHGVHHRFARIPQYRLHEASDLVTDASKERKTLFSSYLSAMLAMFACLGDPKVGHQWLGEYDRRTGDELCLATGSNRDIHHEAMSKQSY